VATTTRQRLGRRSAILAPRPVCFCMPVTKHRDVVLLPGLNAHSLLTWLHRGLPMLTLGLWAIKSNGETCLIAAVGQDNDLTFPSVNSRWVRYAEGVVQ
jgi:hypothetical protein